MTDPDALCPASYGCNDARTDPHALEVFPLVCPCCGHEMRIIAFVTDSPTVRRILDHIGEPSEPPPISPCRGPSEWDDTVEPVFLDDVAQQEPEYPFDQSVSW